MSKKYKTSIIILNWNGFENTVICIKSVLKIKDSYRILVIDNGSKDDDAKKLKKIFGHKIDIYELNENRGFTGGVNFGLKTAIKKYNSNYYLLLNNDTEVDTNFLKYLVKTAETSSKIGLVGSVLVDYFDRKKINYSGGGINWLLAKHYRESIPISKAKKTRLITGCSLLIKKEILEKIGLLDDIFFAYFEDSVLCLKTIKAGYFCVCDPRSIVYHKEQGSTGHRSKIYTYLMSRNRILFVNKYTPFLYHIYFFIFISIKLIAVQMYFLATNQRDRAYAFFRGYADGYKGIGGKPRI